MSLDLNMTLGKKAKPKYPAKKSMNLMVREDESGRPSRLLLTLLVVVIVVTLFTKFGVIDRLASVSAAEDKLSLARAQLEDMNSSLRSFDKVREDYHRYSDGYLTEEEKALPDRLDLLSMLMLLLIFHLFLLLIAEFSEVHDLAHRRLAGFSNNDEVKRYVFRSLTCLIEFQNTQLFAIRADHA